MVFPLPANPLSASEQPRVSKKPFDKNGTDGRSQPWVFDAESFSITI